jgi:chromosome segregation ATPase
MRTPTETELQHLGAVGSFYDPVKAHEYYEAHKHLKGRQKGSTLQPLGFAKANTRRHEAAKPRQRRELQARIQSLSSKLQKLEAKIREMEHEEAREDRKSKAKKERAAKERDKPKTAAEKAEAARDAKKYRDKNQQKLKSKSDDKQSTGKSGGGSSKKKSGAKKPSVSDLKALATKVRGQIAVAKQKLAAL